MLTIAVLNQKGGVGKSTLSTNLAAAAHLKRERSLVVDLDAQGSAFDWYAARAEGSELAGLAVVKADRALSLSRFREIASSYDVVILDGPPKLGEMTRSAAVAADIVLIPVQPGPFDLWGSAETLKLLDAADETRADLSRRPVRRLFVINRAHRSANLSREAASSLDGRVPVPFLPEDERRKLDAASRVIMRAKLGDLTAKQFISGIADAAKAGEHAATHIGDTLLDASKVVSHIAELPLVPLEHVPGIGPIVKSVSPFQTWDHIADAVKKGDLKALESIAKQQLSLAQGVVSLIPGIGTGISAAISAGLAVLEGGGPLEIAIKTAYGALPIPPGIRQVTDVVLDTVLDLAFHHASLTDVVVNVARDQVPSGFPRDVFDTLVNIVVKHKPIVQVAGGLVDHFVKQYAPAGIGLDVPRALAGAVSHLPNTFASLPPGVPHGLEHVFAPLHGAIHGGVQAPRVHLDLRGARIEVPPPAAPRRLPASSRMVQPLRTAIA